jgi:hypothetical protein
VEWSRCLAVSEGAQPSIIVEFVFIIVVELGKLLEVELVTHNGTDTTKALDELVALRGTVRDEFQVGTKVAVLFSEPLEHGALLNDFHLLSSLLVHEDAAVRLLRLGGVEDDFRACRALQHPASDFQVLKDDQSLGSTCLEGLEGVVDTVADLARVLGNVVKVLVDQLLLLDELDVAERLSSQLNGLVETVLASVGNIDDLDDLGLQTVVEQIGLVQVVLEVGGTSQDDTGNVDLVSGDKVLDSQFGDLADVVVTLLLSQTGKTQGGLTTTAVLLGQIDGEPADVSAWTRLSCACHSLVNNFTRVTRQGAKEGAVSVHDDEAKLLIRFEQLAQGLGMELVVTEIQRRVDGLEGLKVDIDLALFTFCSDDFTAVDDKAIGRDLGVELQTLLRGRNGRQDGETVDTGLDVGGSTLGWLDGVSRLHGW